MNTTRQWLVANKIKTALGLVAALAAVVVMPVSYVTWASAQTAEQIKEAGLIQQGREDVIHSAQNKALEDQRARHDYDFYEIRVAQAEEELIQLEEEADSGVQLTATQQRKMRRLEQQVEDFQGKQDEALDQLSITEHEHETGPETN